MSSAKIRLLPDTVSKQIRSGFTINSLATCIKELLENSLDAKPSRIDIVLERQGYDSIMVRDDGSGISLDDLPHVAKRFYTSKYESNFSSSLSGASSSASGAASHRTDVADDTGGEQANGHAVGEGDKQNVDTGKNKDEEEEEEGSKCPLLGFRGEALHSLCNNCEEMTLITKTEMDELGTKVVFDSDGNIVNEQKLSSVKGTTVIVRNLFGRGLPVRRKRLLDDLQREFSVMMDVVHEICLSPMSWNTIITVKNKQDSAAPLFVKQKHSNMGESICNIFSRLVLQQMVMLTSDNLPETNLLSRRVPFKVALHVPRMNNGELLPNTPKKTKLFLFLNGRPIDHFTIKNVMKSFYREISSTLFLGICCIDYESIEALNDHVDVFLAPNKREVKFAQETQVVRIIRDILELVKPMKTNTAEISPETAAVIMEDQAKRRAVMNGSTSTAPTAPATQRAPLATQIEILLNSKPNERIIPISRSPVVARVAQQPKDSPNKTLVPSIPNENGVLEPIQPIQFQHHYTKKTVTTPNKNSTRTVTRSDNDDDDDLFESSSSSEEDGERRKKSATLRSAINVTNKRISPSSSSSNAKNSVEPVQTSTQDATFFTASKYKPAQARNDFHLSDDDDNEATEESDDEAARPNNRSIMEFFGTDSQKKRAKPVVVPSTGPQQHQQQQQRRKRKPDPQIQILDLSTGGASAKKQKLMTTTAQDQDSSTYASNSGINNDNGGGDEFIAVTIRKLLTDDVCTKFVNMKMRTPHPPISTRFIKCFEDANWRIRRSDLAKLSILGPAPIESTSDVKCAPILLQMPSPGLAHQDQRSDVMYRTANCSVLLMSVFEACRLIQLSTLKGSANYETSIQPLDNPVNLLAIPKFKQNQKVLHALVAPFFDSVLRQNGFLIEVVKQTRTNMSQNQNSQTHKTQTVLTALRLRGVARPKDLELVESNTTIGPYGEEDLLDLAIRLIRFKDEILPGIVERLMNYKRMPNFDREHPIANKTGDQLKEYVCKKAMGALRPKRIKLLLEMQATKNAEALCRDCLLPTSNAGHSNDDTTSARSEEPLLRRYDMKLLSKLAEDTIQKLSGPLLTSPVARMADAVARSAGMPIDERDKEKNEIKIGLELRKLFVPVCTF